MDRTRRSESLVVKVKIDQADEGIRTSPLVPRVKIDPEEQTLT